MTKDNSLRYRASKHDCELCTKAPLLPEAPARKVLRSIYEGARDMAREIAKTEAYQISRKVSGRRSRCCSPTSSAS